MPPAFGNMQFNPGQVMMGQPTKQSPAPWMPINKFPSPGGTPQRPIGNPAKPEPQQPQANTGGGAGSILGPQAVRATGNGPYDSAYRQNLATYAGGLMSKPGGLLAFNPTDPNSLGGQPTGAGNAPVMGAPTGLLDQALGGNPFSWTPQPPTQPAQSAQNSTNSPSNYWKFWLNQYNNPFNSMRGARSSY